MLDCVTFSLREMRLQKQDELGFAHFVNGAKNGGAEARDALQQLARDSSA